MPRGRSRSRRGRRGTSLSCGGALAVLFVIAVAVALGSGQSSGSPTAGTSTPPGALATTDSPVPTPTDAPTVAATPPPTPPPNAAPPADPCHVGGVAYCVLNPNVTQATIGSTICVSGWTATVRPPESYTENLKNQQIAQEGLPGGPSNYEEDHRMPLELGGAPRDVMNLSPEAPPAPNPKDADETSLKYDVCDGRLTLAQAQLQMASTWLAAYPRYRR